MSTEQLEEINTGLGHLASNQALILERLDMLYDYSRNLEQMVTQIKAKQEREGGLDSNMNTIMMQEFDKIQTQLSVISLVIGVKKENQ